MIDIKSPREGGREGALEKVTHPALKNKKPSVNEDRREKNIVRESSNRMLCVCRHIAGLFVLFVDRPVSMCYVRGVTV